MRPSSERKDGTPEVRVGRHREKLEEIRESLKAYEHESQQHQQQLQQLQQQQAQSCSDSHNNGNSSSMETSSSSRAETTPKTRHAPQAPTQSDIQQLFHRSPVLRNNGNSSAAHSIVQPPTMTTTTNYRFEMQQAPPIYQPQISPVFQRPPPPAYDAPPPKNLRMTPVSSDNYRTHLHINTQPKYNIQHHKTMAPLPPSGRSGGTTVSIEQNVTDMTGRNEAMTSRLYHTSLDQKNANSVVSINVASPHTTKVNLGDGPLSTKSFVIGPRYTTDMDRTKIFVNYTDELRQDPRMVPSTSSSVNDEESYRNNHNSQVLFKPPNLDITFQSRQHNHNPPSYDEPSPVRATSPIDRAHLDSYLKSPNRRVQACKPNMFRFYMEQHVERLLQQYREREKRMRQLEKEMNAANLPELMRKNMLEFLQQKESRYTRLRRQKMSKSHFTIISHIGLGAFGKVSLVRKNDTGKVYAMKSLEKADVIMKQQAAHVKAERDILAEADSHWIVRLFFSFQDEACLYFIMEYVPGGDMMTLLIQKGVFEEKLARFYIAELTCAIEYVHSVGFIHRDIKPDNILIDQHGHIKLTDFGLCTGLRWTHDRRFYGPENDHQRVDSFSLPPEVAEIERSVKVLKIRQQSRRQYAHSVVGTGNYMAPEVITRSGHTQSCDWWSMGVILYEMVFGRVPFHSENPAETQFRIVHWKQYLDLSYGRNLSPECLVMIQQLVCDVMTRIGSRGGAAQIKQHPWFKGIDFENLRKSKAEYIPTVEHEEDTSNFDTFQVNDKTEKPVRPFNNPAFYEFTYRHFFDTDSLGCPSLRPPTRRRSLRPLLQNGMFDDSSTISEEDTSSHV